MQQENISEIKIPPLPTVSFQVIRYNLEHPESGIADMERIVSPDKGICTDLLRVSNSAFYGHRGQMASLSDAISLLGLKTVKNLIILLFSKNLSGGIKSGYLKRYVNEYPVISALTAMELSDPLGLPEEKDNGFVSGLLHKIGMTFIALEDGEAYESLIRKAEERHERIQYAEREYFGLDHVSLTEEAFKHWNLPPELQDVAHDVEFPIGEIALVSNLVRLTSLASLVAKRFLDLGFSEAEECKLSEIFSFFDAGEVQDRVNLEFFEAIKEHPFYTQATSS